MVILCVLTLGHIMYLTKMSLYPSIKLATSGGYGVSTTQRWDNLNQRGLPIVPLTICCSHDFREHLATCGIISICTIFARLTQIKLPMLEEHSLPRPWQGQPLDTHLAQWRPILERDVFDSLLPKKLVNTMPPKLTFSAWQVFS